MNKLFLLLFGMISLSCKYFLKTWWWPSRNHKSLFQIFLIHCDKSLLALEAMSVHCREWSTCPQNTSGYHLHEVKTGDKGISGNSCQNTNICSTPSPGVVKVSRLALRLRRSARRGLVKKHHVTDMMPRRAWLKSVALLIWCHEGPGYKASHYWHGASKGLVKKRHVTDAGRQMTF